MRYIQQDNRPTKKAKEPKPREMPKAGGYSVKDLKGSGVKQGLWENHNG